MERQKRGRLYSEQGEGEEKKGNGMSKDYLESWGGMKMRTRRHQHEAFVGEGWQSETKTHILGENIKKGMG